MSYVLRNKTVFSAEDAHLFIQLSSARLCFCNLLLHVHNLTFALSLVTRQLEERGGDKYGSFSHLLCKYSKKTLYFLSPGYQYLLKLHSGIKRYLQKAV